MRFRDVGFDYEVHDDGEGNVLYVAVDRNQILYQASTRALSPERIRQNLHDIFDAALDKLLRFEVHRQHGGG